MLSEILISELDNLSPSAHFLFYTRDTADVKCFRFKSSIINTIVTQFKGALKNTTLP